MRTTTEEASCTNCFYKDYPSYEEPCNSCSLESNWKVGTVIIKPGTILDTQVGGDHYKMPIQPIEFIVKNEISYREGNAIKYICRHKKKNGAQDIEKAIHYLTMILEDYKNE